MKRHGGNLQAGGMKGIFRAGKLCEVASTLADSCHDTFVKAHRICNTKMISSRKSRM